MTLTELYNKWIFNISSKKFLVFVIATIFAVYGILDGGYWITIALTYTGAQTLIDYQSTRGNVNEPSKFSGTPSAELSQAHPRVKEENERIADCERAASRGKRPSRKKRFYN